MNRMTGPNDEWMRGRVDEVLARATRPDRVEVLGFVDDLVDLYRGASALVLHQLPTDYRFSMLP